MPNDSSMRSVLRGRAFYEDSGAPIRRGRIGLVRIDEENFPGNANLQIQNDLTPQRWFYTGDDGSFEFRNIRAGKYYVAVDVPNVLSPQSVNAYFGGHRNVSKRTLDELFTTVELDGVNELVVSVPVKRGASISGFVRHSDRTPWVTGEIKLFRISDSPLDELMKSIKTLEPDDRGYFRFTDLLPGDYYISVKEFVAHTDSFNSFLSDDFYSPSASEIETFYPSSLKLSDAKTISVGWGTAIDNIQITTPDRTLRVISGSVIASDTGSPPARAWVEFDRIIDPATDQGYFAGNLENQMNTDKNGTFLFKELPPGQYRVKAWACEESFLNRSCAYGAIIKTVDISSADIRDLKLELPLGSTMRGTIEGAMDDSPLNTFWIFLIDPETKLRFQTTVSQRSEQKLEFTLNGIAEGSYFMSVVMDDDVKLIVDKIMVGNEDHTNNRFSVTAGRDIDNVRIVLTKNFATLKGKLVDERNAPAIRTLVVLYPVESQKSKGYVNVYNAITDVNGEFEIKAAPGEYYVVLPDKDRDQNPNEEERMEDIRRTSTKILLEENKTTKTTLRMPTKN